MVEVVLVRAVAWVVLWCALARGASADETRPAVDLATYTFGAGDLVAVEVVGEEAMTGSVRVSGDGFLEVKGCGRVKVGGLVLDDAVAAITAHLGRSCLVAPQVLVNLVQVASKRVEVVGGVATPGIHSLDRGGSRVSDLLVLAGGLVDPATPRAEIWRDVPDGREIVQVDLEAVSRGDLGADVPIVPGDRLVIPEPKQVFVDGKVGKPGPYVYRDGMTITQAMATAGGATETADTRRVQLRRGTDRELVNVRRILAGNAADKQLRPGDIVYVPESIF